MYLHQNKWQTPSGAYNLHHEWVLLFPSSICNEVNIHQLFHFILRLGEHRCLINSKHSISACDFHRHVFSRFCHTRRCDWDLGTTTNFTYTFLLLSQFYLLCLSFHFLSLGTWTWFIGFRVKRFQQNSFSILRWTFCSPSVQFQSR